MWVKIELAESQQVVPDRMKAVRSELKSERNYSFCFVLHPLHEISIVWYRIVFDDVMAQTTRAVTAACLNFLTDFLFLFFLIFFDLFHTKHKNNFLENITFMQFAFRWMNW